MKTEQKDYTDRLLHLGSGWKKLFCVQLPYRLHLQWLRLGFVLDLGCGIGRNLLNLDGRGVGVDHNPHSVAVAGSRGLQAYVPGEFHRLQQAGGWSFDSILISHVLEHMLHSEAVDLVREYLGYLPGGGRVVMITPQECGYRSDATHVSYTDFAALTSIAEQLGLHVEKAYSYPLPRWCGKFFRHNEFVVIARKP